jgi:hypothetical protein
VVVEFVGAGEGRGGAHTGRITLERGAHREDLLGTGEREVGHEHLSTPKTEAGKTAAAA